MLREESAGRLFEANILPIWPSHVQVAAVFFGPVFWGGYNLSVPNPGDYFFRFNSQGLAVRIN
jgi:hypothetical protein